MNDSVAGGLEPFVRGLLWNAVEGTYLIEIREDVEDSGLTVEAYRAEAGAALMRLLDGGLVRFSVGDWGSDVSRPASRDEVALRLADGSAWDPERTDLLIVDATPDGRRALGAGE
jgi:hypothetical protein